MTYDNTNKGAAWGNKRKERDSQPDLTGSINVEGKEFWVSVWKRKPGDKPSAPAIRFQVKRKEENQQQTQQQAPQQTPQDDFDDDIPF